MRRNAVNIIQEILAASIDGISKTKAVSRTNLNFTLMEEYLPGQTDNRHDYLIPTIGDVPIIETILIEDREPLGPGGAKGVGEPALIPTPPAILGAIRHATGLRIEFVPCTPHRLRSLLRKRVGQ